MSRNKLLVVDFIVGFVLSTCGFPSYPSSCGDQWKKKIICSGAKVFQTLKNSGPFLICCVHRTKSPVAERGIAGHLYVASENVPREEARGLCFLYGISVWTNPRTGQKLSNSSRRWKKDEGNRNRKMDQRTRGAPESRVRLC